MGPFSRQPECEKVLADTCSGVGSALGKVAVGEMPSDFLAAVIGGCHQRITDSFAEVKALKGERKALKIACSSAGFSAGVHLDVRNRPARQARLEAEDLIRRLCVGVS